MADNIGSLVVKLSADLAGFDTDLKRAMSATDKAMAGIEKSIAGAMRAFGALGVGLSLAGFAAMAKQTIDAAAALDDLSEKTGASVESLSKFAGVARVTGQDMGTVEQAMNRLSKSIVEAQDGSSDAARAFAAFGLSIKNADGSLKNSGDLMGEIAVAQQKFVDGAGKAAAMQVLMGKAAAENIPFFNDYVRLSDEISVTTAKQAAEAETYKIQLGLLGENFSKLLREAVLPLLPTLNQLTKAFADSAGYGNSLSGVALVMSGAFKGLATVAISVVEIFKQVGTSIAAVVGAVVEGAQGNFARAWEILKMGGADMVASIKSSVGAIAQIWSADAAPAINAVTAATEKSAVAFGKAGESGKKAAAEIAKLRKEQERLMAEFDKMGEQYFAEYEKRQQEYLDSVLKSIEADAKSLEQIKKVTQGYEDQADALNLNKDQILAREESRLIELANNLRAMEGAQDLAQAYDDQAAAIRRLRAAEEGKASRDAAKEMASEFDKQADSITNSLTDALLRGFESGKDFAENFVDTLKNMFNTLVLRPIIQAIVKPLAGGIAGMLPGGASAGGFGGGSFFSGAGWNPFGNGFSLSGNTFGGYANQSYMYGPGEYPEIFAGTFGSSFTSSMTSALGGASIGAAIGTIGASVFGNERNSTYMSIGGTVGGAIGGAVFGPIGAIIGSVLGTAVGSLFKTGGGPKTGGWASSIPDLERTMTPNQKDSDLQKIVDATQQSYDKMLQMLGGKGTAGFSFEFDTDPEGTASDRIGALARVNGQDVYSIKDLETGRDPEVTQAKLALEVKRTLLAALQASDLPQDIANILNAVIAATGTEKAIDNVLGVATALGSVYELFNSSVLEDGVDLYKDSLRGVNTAVIDQISDIEKLILAYDGTAEKATELASATDAIYQAATQAIAQMTALRRAISEMFTNAATNYRLAGMDNAAQRAFWVREIEKDTAELAGETDAKEIERLSGEINQGQQAYFNLLTPEEQMASAESFAQAAEAAGALADERMANAIDNLESVTEKFLTDVKEVFLSVGVKMDGAADKQVAAANTPQTINVAVEVSPPGAGNAYVYSEP